MLTVVANDPMTASDFIERLLALWNDPPPAGDAARASFLELYTNPVRVNGTDLSVDELVARARALAATLSQRRTEILSTVREGEKLAVAFRIHAKHTGSLTTPLGDVPPSGRDVAVQVIDILTLREGRIAEIWMVPDTFGQLLQLDALRLK